jgi:hypothetical protein
MTSEPVATREFLRHTIATVAYRGGKVVRDAPGGFDTFRIGDTGRSAVQILAHLGDLLEWTLHLCRGEQVWRDAAPGTWDEESARFFVGLTALDAFLASDAPLQSSAERVFQGPIADALTHVGQLAMLRRLAGGPIRGENYFKADIEKGRVGAEQARPVREFD